MSEAKAKKKKLSIPVKLAIALVLGVVAGLIFKEKASYVAFIGTLFIRLLKMCVYPLVLFSIIAGIANVADIVKLKKIGGQFLLYTFLSSAIAGVLVGIPVLRLRGDYLAIVTLAFGEIIKSIVNNLYIGWDSRGIHMSILEDRMNLAEDGVTILGGPMGASGIDKISTFTAGILLVLFCLFVIFNLVNSRSGRAIMALRDNRIAAESVGINVTKYKLMAFVISAAMAGMAGTLFAMNFSTVVASKFDFNTSILVLVFVVLGGLGNMRGSIIAAALLTVLPELLRQFSDYRMLVYAIVLILVMLATNNPQLRALIARFTGFIKTKTGSILSRCKAKLKRRKPKAAAASGKEENRHD